MKRILGVILAILMVCGLAGCGKKDRIMYNAAKLTDYVKLTDYKKITVDTKSDEFEEAYNNIIQSDIKNNDLYVEKTEGKVAEGDIANIDYVGKKDGVAFDGGTAEGYDLEIGSGSFIDGFEEGLIGVNIGDTVDLNLTFPEGYQSTELAGKAVVFTVKVNYVKSTEALQPEDYFEQLDFKSLKAYEKDVKDRAIENCIYDIIIEKSEIKDYPKEDAEFLKDKMNEMLESQLSSYGMTMETYLAQNSITKEDFEEDLLKENVYPMMDETMPMYAILDKEKIKVTQKDIDAKIKEIVKEQNNANITAEALKEYYGDYYFENMIANEKALKAVKEYVKVK